MILNKGSISLFGSVVDVLPPPNALLQRTEGADERHAIINRGRANGRVNAAAMASA